MYGWPNQVVHHQVMPGQVQGMPMYSQGQPQYAPMQQQQPQYGMNPHQYAMQQQQSMYSQGYGQGQVVHSMPQGHIISSAASPPTSAVQGPSSAVKKPEMDAGAAHAKKMQRAMPQYPTMGVLQSFQPASRSSYVVRAPGAKKSPLDTGRDLRKNSLAWGKLKELSDSRAEELERVVALIESNFIPKSILTEGEELLTGSLGRVLRASMDGVEVVVKEVDAQGGEGVLERLRDILLELAVLCRVRHPNIVTFWGTACTFPVTAEGDPYVGLVFERCHQGSLRMALAKGLSGAIKLSVAKDVAQGLKYLHTRRMDDKAAIVHRDISPDNILITEKNVAKIADFGTARVMNGDKIQTSTTAGTPAYMAPEQLDGQELSLAVDVWSYSVVVWEMLNETVPWSQPGQSVEEAMDSLTIEAQRTAVVEQGRTLALSEDVAALYPAELCQVVRQGLQLVPEDRPTIHAIWTMLEGVEIHAPAAQAGSAASGAGRAV